MGADANHTRRPLNGYYLQNGQLPEPQTLVAAAALVAKSATSADAIVRIVVFMNSPFARPGARCATVHPPTVLSLRLESTLRVKPEETA